MVARTWQYSRWRRLTLQGVMCLILTASVGVAAYVQHARRPPRVTMGPVIEHGRLKYALPDGWKWANEFAWPISVVAREPVKRGRTLRVAIIPSSQRVDAESMLAIALRVQLPAERLETIDFLGRQGVFVEANFDDAEGQRSGLYAAVVLEDGTGVIVSIRGDRAFGPSSRALLKDVTRSMQLVTAPGTEAADAR
jgi:hypothetical protein